MIMVNRNPYFGKLDANLYTFCLQAAWPLFSVGAALYWILSYCMFWNIKVLCLCLSVSLSSLWLNLPLCLPLFLCMSLFPCLFLSFSLSCWLPLTLCLSACFSLPLCMSFCLSLSLSLRLSVCLYLCLSLSLCVWLYLCVPVFDYLSQFSTYISKGAAKLYNNKDRGGYRVGRQAIRPPPLGRSG